MKATGIVRKVDELGRVVIPVELRRTLNIAERDKVEIFTEDNTIILKKYEKSCTFCGSTKHIREFQSKTICDKCIEKINKL